jgi:plastocyanin
MNTCRPTGLYLKVFSALILLYVAGPAVAATHDVTVRNTFFTPNNITIAVGDTVRWTNNAGLHDVKADDNSFSSPTATSFVFSRTFMSVAEVRYYCSVHSSPGQNINTNMNGRINVVEAQPATDVSIESLNAADGGHEAGEDLQVSTQLKNNSAVDSGIFQVKFYASGDSTINTSDTLIGTKQVSNIAAGASLAVDENVNLPAGLAAGDYFIGAILDIGDSNPANDTGVDSTAIFVFTQFSMNAGLNDAWYNPLTNGQGFFITIFPDLGVVTLAWFTYDTELPPPSATANLGDPGHRWMTALGPIAGDQSDMAIEFTSGGIFDAASDITRTDPPGSDGTLKLKFDDCNTGSIEYDITSINAQGTVPIERVAADNAALCNALLREAVLGQ